MTSLALKKAPVGCGLCPTRHVCTARNLDEVGLQALSECLITSPPMNKGDYLYRTGDGSDCWYVIRSGVFKGVTVTASGEEYITGFFYPGELVGIGGAATGRQQESVVALSSATACQIHHARFPTLWDSGAGASLLRLLAERQLANEHSHINLSQSRAELRIAGYFKQLMDRLTRLGFDPCCIPAPMSRTDLANHLGLTLECLSRILSKWRKAGVIETHKDTILIHKQEELVTTAYHLAA